MFNIFHFIRDNFDDILNTVVMIFAILILLNLFDINFDFFKNTSLGKVVTIESMESMESTESTKFDKNDVMGDLKFHSFDNENYCDLNKDPKVVEEYCNLMLDKAKCTKQKCCVWANDKQCISGDKDGPTYHGSSEKNMTTYNSYIHKDKI